MVFVPFYEFSRFRIYFKFIFHSAVVNFSFVLQDTILMFQLHFQILLGRAGYTAKSHVFLLPQS